MHYLVYINISMTLARRHIDKGFRLFAMQISPKMAKISLSFESHGIGCNITYHLYFVLADRKHIKWQYINIVCKKWQDI
jgi:hypothetical protein